MHTVQLVYGIPAAESKNLNPSGKRLILRMSQGTSLVMALADDYSCQVFLELYIESSQKSVGHSAPDYLEHTTSALESISSTTNDGPASLHSL